MHFFTILAIFGLLALVAALPRGSDEAPAPSAAQLNQAVSNTVNLANQIAANQTNQSDPNGNKPAPGSASSFTYNSLFMVALVGIILSSSFYGNDSVMNHLFL